MAFTTQLRKIISAGLIVFTLLFGTAFISNDRTQALAKSMQGDSSVAAYRRLQQATYDYRGQLQDEEMPSQRSGRRMNDRSNLSDRAESANQDGRTWAKNAKQSIRQAADMAREKLSD